MVLINYMQKKKEATGFEHVMKKLLTTNATPSTALPTELQHITWYAWLKVEN